MTLISRNKFLTIFCISCGIVLLAILTLFAYKFFTGSSMNLPMGLTFENFSVKNFLFSSYTIFPIIAISFLGTFSLIISCLIKYSFEKTQSPEIIYFIGFLFGCLLETIRLLIPILNIWTSYSIATIFIGKVVFTGRLTVVFSLLFASLFTRDAQNQEPERNLLFIVIFSMIFAVFIPVNSGTILSSVMPQIGFNTLFICIFSIIFILSCISLFFTERKKLIIPYMILILGYIFLVFSSNLVLLFLGIALSSYGAYSYLGRLHNHYLWS